MLVFFDIIDIREGARNEEKTVHGGAVKKRISYHLTKDTLRKLFRL
jgi:hypothetical protein